MRERGWTPPRRPSRRRLRSPAKKYGVKVWGQAGANPLSGSIWRRSSVVEQAAHNRCVGGSNPPAATPAVAPRKGGATKKKVGFHNMRSAWREAMGEKKFERVKPPAKIRTHR